MRDVITIDGPSGAGKSTVSRILARRLGYKYLDTGALYRAVAWKMRDEGAGPDDEERLRSILDSLEIHVEGEKIFVNGTDVTKQIREPEIGELSSRLSALPMVRKHLFTMQRKMGLAGRIVIEGRDIGTAIFPEAENKFFIDASIEERARRRYEELRGKASDENVHATLEAMKKRDKRDSTRQNAPLKRTEDMVYIDTSRLSLDEVVSTIMGALREVNRAGRGEEKRVSRGQAGDDMPVFSSWAGNLFYRFSCLVLRLIFRINGGLNVIGERNIPPEGGVILASNHISYLDPPLMAAALPRRATFIARKGLFGIPVLGWYIRHYAFPVDRERPHPSTIKDALKRLKRGELIVMFPEGRRSETGELLEGKRGIGMIAKLGRAVIVPALIVGSDKALAPGKKWLQRARISVIFGRPLEPPSSDTEDHRESEEITRDIMGAIAAIKQRHGDIRS